MFASTVGNQEVFVQFLVGTLLIGGPLLLAVAAVAGYMTRASRGAG